MEEHVRALRLFPVACAFWQDGNDHRREQVGVLHGQEIGKVLQAGDIVQDQEMLLAGIGGNAQAVALPATPRARQKKKERGVKKKGGGGVHSQQRETRRRGRRQERSVTFAAHPRPGKEPSGGRTLHRSAAGSAAWLALPAAAMEESEKERRKEKEEEGGE